MEGPAEVVRHRRCLVTGGAGFVGSHLVETLLGVGDDVVVVDDLSTGSLENLAAVDRHPRLTFVKGSVDDADLLDGLARDTDVVWHLASVVGVDLVLGDPLAAFTRIVDGARAVTDAAARHGCRLVLVSSSEVYGTSADLPLREDGPLVLGPPTAARWAYAAAKLATEHLAFGHRRHDGLAVVVIRLFNTVGPRQRPDFGMVLPRLVIQAAAGRPLTVYGDGTQTRSFCHVADVVRGMVEVAGAQDAVGTVVNLGSDEEVSILELAHRVADRAGTGSEIELVSYDDAYGPGFADMARRVPDTTRVRELCGWRPDHDLEHIIDELLTEAGR